MTQTHNLTEMGTFGLLTCRRKLKIYQKRELFGGRHANTFHTSWKSAREGNLLVLNIYVDIQMQKLNSFLYLYIFNLCQHAHNWRFCFIGRYWVCVYSQKASISGRFSVCVYVSTCLQTRKFPYRTDF